MSRSTQKHILCVFATGIRFCYTQIKNWFSAPNAIAPKTTPTPPETTRKSNQKAPRQAEDENIEFSESENTDDNDNI